jgi:gluconolactonase
VSSPGQHTRPAATGTRAILRRASLAVALALPAPLPFASAQNLRGDEALSTVLVAGEGWQAIAEGVNSPGASFADAEGNYYVSDAARGVLRVAADGAISVWWKEAPRLARMSFASDGRLFAITAEPRSRLILVAPSTRKVRVLASGLEGGDLAITSQGLAYFTDTVKGRVLLAQGHRRPRVVASGLARPTGLTFSGDQATLVVAEGGGSHAWAFRVELDGSLAFAAPWVELRLAPDRTASGAGGMATDAEGRFYLASPVGIQMFDWTGRLGGVIAGPTAEMVTGCAFAGPERAYLYVTSSRRVFRRKTKAHGAPL